MGQRGYPCWLLKSEVFDDFDSIQTHLLMLLPMHTTYSGDRVAWRMHQVILYTHYSFYDL